MFNIQGGGSRKDQRAVMRWGKQSSAHQPVMHTNTQTTTGVMIFYLFYFIDLDARFLLTAQLWQV